MFGYIMIDKETINAKDYRLFNSFYCGLCLSFKRRYGNKLRIFNNFDSTFAFILLASYCSYPVLINNKNCIVHPFRKTPMLELEKFDNVNISDEQKEKLHSLSKLAEDITDITILLVKGKMYDDVLDKERGAKFKWNRLTKAFDFATKQKPEFEKIVIENTVRTAELEKLTPDIQELAFLSGEILGYIPLCILGIDKNNSLYELFVEIGKWIYYVDAINDLEKDYKKKSFNAFISLYGNYTTRQEFIAKNKINILKYLDNCLNNIKNIYQKLRPNQANTLVENVLFSAMEKQQKAIIVNPNKKITM